MTKNTKFLLLTIAFWIFCGAALQMSYQRNSWLQNDGLYIGTDEIRARDGDGLKLYDDASNGIFVEDGGNIGVGNNIPSSYQAGTKDIVIGNTTGGHGLTIVSSSSNFGQIAFSRGTTGDDKFRGIIAYNQVSDEMSFWTNATQKITLDTSGNLGIGATSPTQKLDVNSDSIRIRTNQSPASTDACDTGEIAWDTSYIYICTSSGNWKRAALTGGY